jgi:two-component sensor histidine kinase
MRAWLNSSAVSDHSWHPLLLAVGEACANVVEHAYDDGETGDVGVAITLDKEGSLLVVVRDSGRWSSSIPKRDRGRGTEIMRGLAADFSRESTTTGTTVRFRIPVASPLPA